MIATGPISLALAISESTSPTVDGAASDGDWSPCPSATDKVTAVVATITAINTAAANASFRPFL
ncbi:hypothetical protein EB74_27525 [Mycobacterium sp. SWH-M5]|nr:hypothetical protein EB74_27525 [Mycobacterium sp. SWH-M5]